MHRRIAILVVVASTLILMGLAAGQALAAGDDDIPGVPIGAGDTSGVLDKATDVRDVYSVKLFEGEEVRFILSNGNCSATLVAPEVKSFNDSYSTLLYLHAWEIGVDYSLDRTYLPAKDGVYHIAIRTWGSGQAYTLTILGSAEVPPSPSYLRLRTSAMKVKKGRSITLSAKLVNVDSALIAGYSVNLFRSYNGRSWTKVTSLSSANGDYSTKARITKKTWYKMRFAGDATWSACESRTVKTSLR